MLRIRLKNFCQVRQCGGRNTNPTYAAYGLYYKSLSLKHFANQHPSNSNGEDDDTMVAVEIKHLLDVPPPAGFSGQVASSYIEPDV
ncbi:hypothetical protein QE152_g273 [Popillia japonica]|uniref:Uncharacterized protein n=1 Tax=Popillia japonica TaxID=7064 RepID=A0AAW1NFD3_POPJA